MNVTELARCCTVINGSLLWSVNLNKSLKKKLSKSFKMTKTMNLKMCMAGTLRWLILLSRNLLWTKLLRS